MDIVSALGFPPSTTAFLFDMDGVLIDSLSFDLANCARILQAVTGIETSFSRETIRDGFALSSDDFWRYLADRAQLALTESNLLALISLFEAERCRQAFPLLPGVTDMIAAIRKCGLKLAVVSNNITDNIVQILNNSGLGGSFDIVIGNDGEGMRKKPFPDSYLLAARRLEVAIGDCVVIEDSLIGAEAGSTAGAFTFGVATGGTSIEDLKASGFCDLCLHSLEVNS